MKLSYSGKTKEFTKDEQDRLDKRLERLGKLVERKGEREGHVTIKSTRHLLKAEIAMRFEDHPVVGTASSPDLYEAVSAALDKLEKQVVKLHEKHRERIRALQPKPAKAPVKKSAGTNGIAAVVAEAGLRSSRSAKVYRVADHRGRKPMTLEEAVLEIKRNQEYLSYPDADTGRVSVLIRRTDGHFDLVEG